MWRHWVRMVAAAAIPPMHLATAWTQGGNSEGAGLALKVEEAMEVAKGLDGGRIKIKVGGMTTRLA